MFTQIQVLYIGYIVFLGGIYRGEWILIDLSIYAYYTYIYIWYTVQIRMALFSFEPLESASFRFRLRHHNAIGWVYSSFFQEFNISQQMQDWNQHIGAPWILAISPISMKYLLFSAHCGFKCSILTIFSKGLKPPPSFCLKKNSSENWKPAKSFPKGRVCQTFGSAPGCKGNQQRSHVLVCWHSWWRLAYHTIRNLRIEDLVCHIGI